MSSAVATLSVKASGEPIEFRLVRSDRRRHAHLFVDPDRGVEVRAATNFDEGQAREFVAAHGDWVRRRLREIRRARPALTSGTRLPLLDETLVLQVCTAAAQLSLLEPAPPQGARTRRARADTRREGRRLFVASDRAGSDGVRQRLIEWYRETAKQVLPARVAQLAGRIGHYPSRVRIKAQRTMWGSCSASGEISLNWRLLLVPSELADYVIAHELCHLEHHDHSPAFWACVARTVPNYKHCRARLKERQHTLAL